jgi:class 3 adenylate cyclase
MLFSDIEGSAALLRRLVGDTARCCRPSVLLMRAAIATWHGREMGTEGDSFFVVFESADDGLLPGGAEGFC